MKVYRYTKLYNSGVNWKLGTYYLYRSRKYDFFVIKDLTKNIYSIYHKSSWFYKDMWVPFYEKF